MNTLITTPNIYYMDVYLDRQDSSAKYLFSCDDTLNNEQYDIYKTTTGSILVQFNHDFPDYESGPLFLTVQLPLHSKLARVVFEFWDQFKNDIISHITQGNYRKNGNPSWDKDFMEKIRQELFAEHTKMEDAIQYCMDHYSASLTNAFILWIYSFEQETIAQWAHFIENLYTAHTGQTNFTIADCQPAVTFIKEQWMGNSMSF